MKKMLVTLAFLNTLFFMSTACSQDDSNYIQPKFEDLGAYTPDDISNWPHAIFSFNDWACTDMQMADNRLGIDPIVRNGSRTTVLAYSSKRTSASQRFGVERIHMITSFKSRISTPISHKSGYNVPRSIKWPDPSHSHH